MTALASPPAATRVPNRADHEPWLGHFVGLLAICALTMFFGLGDRAIWDVDEGMHAATSRAIIESGDWVVPTFSGKPFLDKPILFNWLVSISFLLLGCTEFAARLPAAVLGTGVVLLTYLFGRRAIGATAGFLGSAVLATSTMHVVLSRTIVHDIALMFFVTAAMVVFQTAYRSPRPSTVQKLSFWILVGLSFLAKGPPGPALVALPILVTLWRDGRWRFFLEMAPWTGIPLALLVGLPWSIAMSVRLDYGWRFLVEKNIGGFLTGERGKIEPPLYYVPVVVAGMFPWSAFLPMAIVRPFRVRGGARDGLMLLEAWFLTCFGFFTFASAKLPTYVLPAFAPLALLVGWVWQQLREGVDERLRRRFRIACLVQLGILGIAALVFWIHAPPRLEERLGIEGHVLAGSLTVLFAIATLAWVAVRRGRFAISFGAHVALTAVILTSFVLVLAPKIELHRSSRALARALDPLYPPGEPLVMFRGLRDSTVFYTGRPWHELKEFSVLFDYLRSSERRLVIVSRDDPGLLVPVVPDAWVVADLAQSIVLSNRPTPLHVPDGAPFEPVRLRDYRP